MRLIDLFGHEQRVFYELHYIPRVKLKGERILYDCGIFRNRIIHFECLTL